MKDQIQQAIEAMTLILEQTSDGDGFTEQAARSLHDANEALREHQRTGGWLPIKDAPRNPDTNLRDATMHLATYIIPSEEAQRNGSKPYWSYGQGREHFKGYFTGILGGKPSHYQPIEPPPLPPL